MLTHHLDTKNGVLRIWPQSKLEGSDFTELAALVDPFIEDRGELAGLIIEAPSFPGWESFGALAAHLRFVRDHHQHIRKVALVTDSVLGTLAEKLAAHFVSAEIRHFSSSEAAEAGEWIAAPTN